MWRVTGTWGCARGFLRVVAFKAGVLGRLLVDSDLLGLMPVQGLRGWDCFPHVVVPLIPSLTAGFICVHLTRACQAWC